MQWMIFLTDANYHLNHDQVNYIKVTPKEVETVIRVSQPKQNTYGQLVLEQNLCTFFNHHGKVQVFKKIETH